MFQTKVVEKIEIHILCSVTFSFPEDRAVYLEIMWKKTLYSRAQVTDGDMARAHCVLDNSGCRYILRICGTYQWRLLNIKQGCASSKALG